MGPFSAVVSDDPQGFGVALAEALRARGASFAPVELAHSAAELEHLAGQGMQNVDLVVVDVALPGLGGIEGAQHLAEWWRSLRLRRSPEALRRRGRLVVVSAVGDDDLVSAAYTWGVDYFVVRPFDVSTLAVRLEQLVGGRRPEGGWKRTKRLREVERRAVRYMEDLGVPPHYKGRAYLKDAIVMVVEDRELIRRVTKELYPRVASLHHTSAFKVERAIRHAIETTVARGNLALIEAMFAHLMDERRTRPTNSSFIARMADQIRADMTRTA